MKGMTAARKPLLLAKSGGVRLFLLSQNTNNFPRPPASPLFFKCNDHKTPYREIHC